MEMIEIAAGINIEERHLHYDFVRAAGPGGQNVNKVASAVQLRFDVRDSSLPDDVKARLIKLAGKRMTQEGELVIEAREFRTQGQNKEQALERLLVLIKKAVRKPKSRRKTKPTASSKERRIKEKKIRGEVKRIRRNKSYDT
jgi:ribosome-associated protein